VSRILCAWELGAGAGHVEPLARVLAALVERGHDVTFASRSLGRASRALQGLSVRLVQAPLEPRLPSTRPPAANYAQLLERVGYDTGQGIADLAAGWCGLIELACPDLLLAEHAPSALLAARICGVPAVAAGTGFTLPPHGEPMPTLLPGTAVSAQALRRSESEVLARINRVLAGAGAQALPCLAALFDVRCRVLWTLPELDHYEGREGDRFLGPVIATPGTPIDWPDGPGARIFGYCHAGYPAFAEVAKALRALDVPAVLVAGGDGADTVEEGARLRVSRRALDLHQAGREASLVVSHAGYGTAATCLLAGCPQLMVPRYVEQRMLAWRLRERGFGEAAAPRAQSIVAAARRMLAEPRYARAARALAARYEDHDEQQPVQQTVRACEDAA